jgi:hypothetical protein
MVNPFTGREPWLFEEKIRQIPALPEGFLEIFGLRPTMAVFKGTPNPYQSYRTAVVQWEQDLRFFKRAGLPEWATSEQIAEAEQLFQAWGMGKPRNYENNHGWMARFVASEIKDYDVGMWTALNWTHGAIAHYQIALAGRGILPEKQHPWVPQHVWTTELEIGKELS